MIEERSTYCTLDILMLGNQLKSTVKFLMWGFVFKGLALAKGIFLVLNRIKDMPNKYEDIDYMKITTYEKKVGMNSIKKNSLYIAYLYQAVVTRKCAGCCA